MVPAAIIPIHEASQVGQARRILAGITSRLSWSEELAGRAALVTVELATNLATHARDGELFVRLLEREGQQGVELLAIDRGPGMEDVDRCLEDGFSTRGTAGKGLGAIRRMAHDFDLHSVQQKGTVVMARVYSTERPADPGRYQLGVVCRPMRGEEVAGDGWACAAEGHTGRFLVVDGLGHGLPASTAARAAEESFLAHPSRGVIEQLRALDQALRGTRGAAASLAEIDFALGRVTYAGVGNISAMATGAPKVQRMVSLNGTLGHTVPRLQEFTYDWSADSVLIMSSDGLSTSWRLDAYPGLIRRHPSVIAGTLYRDHWRGRDDVTVLVARARGEER